MSHFLCPCCSTRDYSNCCRPLLDKTCSAPDPEALMRSRYTAFCREDADYLMATLDSDKRSDPKEIAGLRRDLNRTMASTQWLGLKVISSGAEGTKGFVEFAAFYHQGSKRGQLHERSLFVLKKGRWYYQEGEILPDILMGQNTPCFCGSNKKFKRCHGRWA